MDKSKIAQLFPSRHFWNLDQMLPKSRQTNEMSIPTDFVFWLHLK